MGRHDDQVLANSVDQWPIIGWGFPNYTFKILDSSYRVFSITWPASMQIYWNKRKCLHKKRVQIPRDLFRTPTWLPFHCFGTPIWPPWRHVKTLYKVRWIRPSVTLQRMSNSRKKGHLLRVIFKNIKNLLIRAYILARQNRWHFTTPPLASPPSDLWETSTETPLILMTCHYLDLGSASDWLKQISHWHHQSETPPRSR